MANLGPVIQIPIVFIIAFAVLYGLDWLLNRWTDDTFN